MCFCNTPEEWCLFLIENSPKSHIKCKMCVISIGPMLESMEFLRLVLIFHFYNKDIVCVTGRAVGLFYNTLSYSISFFQYTIMRKINSQLFGGLIFVLFSLEL